MGVGKPANESAPSGDRLSPAHLSGLLVDRSTTGRTSGVSLRLDLFTSPVSPFGVAGDAAFTDSTPVPRHRPRWHRFTLTRLPVPSVLAPINSDPLAESPVGVAPVPSGSSTTAPLPTGRPKTTRVPIASPHRLATRSCPVPSERSSRSPSPSATRRSPSARSPPRRPRRSPVAVADSSLPPTSRRSSTAGSRWP